MAAAALAAAVHAGTARRVDAVIDLPAGVTVLTAPLALPAGAATVHVRGNGRATLAGGFTIERPDWRPPDAALAGRLPAEARRQARVLELPDAAVGRWPDGLAGPVHSGHTVAVAAAPTEVFVGGRALVPARWPNVGWAAIERVIDIGSVPRNAEPDIPAAQRSSEAPRGGSFVPAAHDRLARWSRAHDAWMHGYWNWDWSDELLPVARIDPGSCTVTLGMPHRYGLAARGRFAIVNLPEELDAPGECWVDRALGRVVAWLPPGDHAAPVTVSMLTGPLIALPSGPGAPRVTVEGVAFECTRGPAIAGEGVEGATVERCSFRNVGTRAVTLTGSRCSVRLCSFEDIGGTGVFLAGGDRASLLPGGNSVEDCSFARCGRLQRTYAPAVEIDGVGNAVLRNEVSDLPHIAVIYAGNEHRIEANLVHHVVQETGDAGAICIGRDWTAHGNVLRGNLVHDIRGTDERYQNAFYVDDMASGITLEDNLVVRCNWGMLIGGGRDNLLLDNAFVDCGKAVMYDARGVGWMAPHIADPSTSTLHRRLAAMPVDREPWASRYPTLRGYLTDRFGRPVGGRVIGSTLVGTAAGSIEDRECVEESATRSLGAAGPEELRARGDALIREARRGPVTVGGTRLGPVGPRGTPGWGPGAGARAAGPASAMPMARRPR
jgi:hypothetical protein